MPNGISGQSQRCTARLFIVGVQCMWATVKDCTIKLLCSGACFVQPSIARCLFHSACLELVFSRARLWSDNQSLSRLFAARLNYWLYVKKVNVNSFSCTINACNSWFIVPNNLLKLLCFEKYIFQYISKIMQYNCKRWITRFAGRWRTQLAALSGVKCRTRRALDFRTHIAALGLSQRLVCLRVGMKLNTLFKSVYCRVCRI
jgi:hypothetical protein